MNNITFTTHDDVVEYIWSIDKTMLNHIFHISTSLYKQYSKYSKKSIPELVTFCKEYHLSLGYVLYENRHPVTMNYYNSDSEIESEDDEICDHVDNTPLLSDYT